jgi:sulfatase maturation enzyme AslB (radical SAM superfamily)
MSKNQPGVTALPYSMQLELTYGCNRRCWFCGIHDTPKDQMHFMSLETARQIGKECNTWKPRMRLEFGTGGEPALNPNFFEIVAALREECPQMQIMNQSNTEHWATSREATLAWIGHWHKSGGNILVLNCYKEGLKQQIDEWLKYSGLDIVDFYNDNPEHRSMYHYTGPKTQTIFVCDDLGQMTLAKKTAKVSQRWLNNQGGSTPSKSMEHAGIPVLTEPLRKRCTQPFRQLVLSWDGSAPLCCYDWVDRYVIGKFPEQSLEEIWNGRPMQVARQLLYFGNRRNHPCRTCDFHGGFRIGIINNPLLPEFEKELEREMGNIVLEQAEQWSLSQKKAVARMNKVQGAGS